MLRCQSGERAAFDALVARWYPRLQKLAAGLTGDRDAACDLVQDAWVAIIRDLRRLNDPARFRVWAYRILRNKCVDWIRRRPLRRNADVELQAAAGARHGDCEQPALEEDDELTQLRAVLRRLPEEQRAMLSLHYLEGLSVIEIASVFDVPTGTVKSRLYKARECLRESIQGVDHERAGQENS